MQEKLSKIKLPQFLVNSGGGVLVVLVSIFAIYMLVGAGSLNLWDNASFGSSAPRGPVVAMSAEKVGTLAHGPAADYCYDLSASAEVAMDGDTSTTYTDWRLPSVEEATVFVGTVVDVSLVWTATVYEAAAGNWFVLKLNDGNWIFNTFTDTYSVRCVR